MKLPIRHSGKALVVGLILLALYLVMSGGKTPPRNQQTVTGETTPSKTTPARKNPTTTSSGQETARPTSGAEIQLQKQLVRLLRKYYAISPGMTTQSRRNSLASVVPAAILNKLDLTVKKDTAKSVSVAEIELNDMDVRVNSRHPFVRDVSVPVMLWVKKDDSPTRQYITLDTHTRWRYSSGGWKLLKFN